LANLRGFKNLVGLYTGKLLNVSAFINYAFAVDFLAAFDLRLFLILIFFGKARGFLACFSFM
jgi:hypothetical protein